MMKALNGLWSYLKDWKNLLTHALIGVGILLVALMMPVKPIYRILILIAVVIFNLVRMNYAKKKEAQAEKTSTPQTT
jgi:diacylglycerol kinase